MHEYFLSIEEGLSSFYLWSRLRCLPKQWRFLAGTQKEQAWANVLPCASLQPLPDGVFLQDLPLSMELYTKQQGVPPTDANFLFVVCLGNLFWKPVAPLFGLLLAPVRNCFCPNNGISGDT